jgi:hypothetical protein
MKKNIRQRHCRRATTVVEMAVMAPLFLAAMMGMIEVGYAFMVKQTVALAAREGARAGALPGGTVADIESAVDASMEAADLPKASMSSDSPSYPPIGGDRDGYVFSTNLEDLGPTDVDLWVEVEIPLKTVSVTGGLFASSNLNITSKTQMRREGVDAD